MNKRDYPRKGNEKGSVVGQGIKSNSSEGQVETENNVQRVNDQRNNTRNIERHVERNNQAHYNSNMPNTNANNNNRYPNRQDRQSFKDYAPRESVKDNGFENNNARRYNNTPRYNQKVKVDETIDEIKADIVRIEKEIELEIKEIKTLKLGL